MRTRAARLVAHSRPIRVEEIDLLEPGEDEVVTRMAFAGVNPVDRYAVEGRVAAGAPVPRTLGTEGAGWLDGRPVVMRGHGLGTSRDGLWASAAAVPERALIPVPDGVPLEQAAVMGIAGVTAWTCALDKAKVTPEDRVLVLGASGGVGSMLVSIARSVGATVWALTGSAGKASWLAERGADHVLVGGVDEMANAATFRPTVVFDPLGGGFFGAAVKIAADKGRIVTFGTSAGPEAEVPLQVLYRKGLTVYGYGGLGESDETLDRGVRAALDALSDGRLKVVIDRVVPLGEVNSALALQADRSVKGKVVLDLQDG